MKFSEQFKVKESQEALEFIDIRLERDNRFFIDLSRIDLLKDEFAKECSQTIHSYFNEVLSLYSSGEQGKAKARELFNDSHESNETHLDLCKGKSVGTGNSQEILTEVFDEIERKLLIQNELIKNPMDIFLFVKNFGEDRLSDLLTNIIKKHLSDFTLQQCERLGIELSDEEVEMGTYWDRNKKGWVKFSARVVTCIVDKPILLVPKRFAVTNYLYHPQKFLALTVFAWRKDFHKTNNTPLAKRTKDKNGKVVITEPSNQTLRAAEITERGLTDKEYLIEQSLQRPQLIITWRNDVSNLLLGSKSNFLTDDAILAITNKE